MRVGERIVYILNYFLQIIIYITSSPIIFIKIMVPPPLQSSRSTGSLTLQNSARRSLLARARHATLINNNNINKNENDNNNNYQISSSRSSNHFIRNDKLITYTPYYSQPNITPRDKTILAKTSRPGSLLQHTSQMDSTSHFPKREKVNMLHSTRSTGRISGMYLAELRRKKVVEKELEENRANMFKLIEDRKLELRRQIHATDRALRVKEQLKTMSCAEGKIIAQKIKDRKISETIIPVSRFNKYGYRSVRDSSHMFNSIGFGDTLNYKSNYDKMHGNHDQKTSRNKIFKHELKLRHPLKEAEFTKFASKAIMANVDLTTVGHGLVAPPRGAVRTKR